METDEPEAEGTVKNHSADTTDARVLAILDEYLAGLKAGHAPDPEVLKRALNPRVRAVVLNSPSNPSGAVLSEKALKIVADAVRGHDCLVVTDDIYEKLLYVDEPFRNILSVAPDLKDRTVVVNGFSKAYSMTGWRLGYAAGPRELIGGMQNIQDQSTSNATSEGSPPSPRDTTLAETTSVQSGYDS